MAKRLSQSGSDWSAGDLKLLKTMARNGEGAIATAKALGRTAPATQQKAMRMGISFRGTAAKKKAGKK